MRKAPKTSGNDILDRVALIDKRYIEGIDVATVPTDEQEFLDWWWDTYAKACQNCILADTRNYVVKPDGCVSAKIMIVGEGPGFLEDLCVSEDTLVSEETGPKKIKDINIGDMVLTKEGVYSRVSMVHNKGIQDTLAISLWGSTYPLQCTKDHRIYARKRIGRSRKGGTDKIIYDSPAWIEAGELKVKDHVLSPIMRVKEIEDSIFLESYTKDTVLKGDLIYPLTKRGRNSRGQFSGKENIELFLHGTSVGVLNRIKLNKDFGTLLGWYLAEGMVGFVKGVPSCISFSLNLLDPIEEIEKSIEAIFGIKGVRSPEPHSDKAVKLTVSSKLIASLVNKLVGTGSHKKFLPNWLINTSEDFRNTLVNSYFRGDGGFSCNFNLLEAIGLMASTLNFAYGIRIFTEPKIRTINGKLINSGRIYQLRLSKNSPKIFSREGYIERSIKKIVKSEVIQTYDLTIDGDPSFYIPTFGLVHNCSVPMVGPLDLQASHCNLCKNVHDCFSSRISYSRYSKLPAPKAVTCKPNYTAKHELTKKFSIRSAGSVFDGILIKKWKFNYPRHNWLLSYNTLHQDAQWTHKSPWFITNTVLCRSTDITGIKDSPPESVPRSKCKKWLAFQWAAVQPDLILCFGRVSLGVLMGNEDGAKTVQPNSYVDTKFGKVLFQLHPAYFLREKSAIVKAYGFAKLASSMERALEYVGLPTT